MEQAIFENFDFLVKVKVLLGQSFFVFSFFYLIFFFFLQAVRTESDFQVDPGQTGVVEDDVIQDVMRKGHVYADSACRRMS